jgi:hypothetical protein
MVDDSLVCACSVDLSKAVNRGLQHADSPNAADYVSNFHQRSDSTMVLLSSHNVCQIRIIHVWTYVEEPRLSQGKGFFKG